MRFTQLLTQTTKDISADEVSTNAQLLTRAGYIYKEMAGVYTYLPLGLRVLENIITIIREEMNAIGSQEVLMNALQRKELWEATDRWSDEASDVWFRSQLKNGTEIGLGWTHEEQVTDIMRQHIKSYKDLPRYAYQFQTKFRNETRAKSGIMRTREFIMKDLYSFSRTQEEHDAFYELVKEAYFKVFTRCGIGEQTYLTFASGGAFSQFSHEFQTITDAGEDIIYINDEKRLAVNEEVCTEDVLGELGITRDSLREAKAAEVGNIFTLGTRFSEPLRLSYKDEEGKEQPVLMGSYGIGPGRLMGVIVELLSDEHGIVWPKSVAPYQIHIVSLGADMAITEKTDALYHSLMRSGIDVIYDDRDEGAGTKLKDADLIGVPTRIALGGKSLEKGVFEVTDRATGETLEIPLGEIEKYLETHV
jgi:prolyl-tRNA synthetase